MTSEEKKSAVKVLISPDTDTDEVIDMMLSLSENMILNRMYPYGYPEGTIIPPRYENIQIQLAVEIYSKRGAEGQVSHSENGISRTWPEKSQLLRQIVPNCGSVTVNGYA